MGSSVQRFRDIEGPMFMILGRVWPQAYGLIEDGIIDHIAM